MLPAIGMSGMSIAAMMTLNSHYWTLLHLVCVSRSSDAAAAS